MIGLRLAAARCPLRAATRVPTMSATRTLLARQTVNTVAQRSWGGGTVGVSKLIILFGSLGGMAAFMTLCFTTIGDLMMWVIPALALFCGYFMFGDSNIYRHEQIGEAIFQDIHVLFTLSFLIVVYVYY